MKHILLILTFFLLFIASCKQKTERQETLTLYEDSAVSIKGHRHEDNYRITVMINKKEIARFDSMYISGKINDIMIVTSNRCYWNPYCIMDSVLVFSLFDSTINSATYYRYDIQKKKELDPFTWSRSTFINDSDKKFYAFRTEFDSDAVAFEVISSFGLHDVITDKELSYKIATNEQPSDYEFYGNDTMHDKTVVEKILNVSRAEWRN